MNLLACQINLANTLPLYILAGLVHGILLCIFRVKIYDWNPELGFNTLTKTAKKGKEFLGNKDKRSAYKTERPWPQRIEGWIHTVLGTIIGWVLLWFLLEKRLDYFSNIDIKFEDIALFILAYVALKGRLPTIADSVQEWFRRG